VSFASGIVRVENKCEDRFTDYKHHILIILKLFFSFSYTQIAKIFKALNIQQKRGSVS
jgi:hypothetical protein